MVWAEVLGPWFTEFQVKSFLSSRVVIDWTSIFQVPIFSLPTKAVASSSLINVFVFTERNDKMVLNLKEYGVEALHRKFCSALS